MTDSNVTGIVNAARKTAITASLQSQERNDGRNEYVKYSFGRERIAPPCFAFSQSFFSCRQKMRARITIRKTAPAAIRIVRQRVLGDVAEALVERAGHGQEQVEVDERAGDREEDLLDQVGGERTRGTSRPG